MTVINIGDYHAVGDGYTDDTEAFTQAFQAIKENGGGTLVVNPGKTYAISATVCPQIYDNTNVVAYGATFKKLVSSTIHAFFVVNTQDGRTPGYGSGAQNITWQGGRFEGDYSVADGWGCAFGLNGVQNMLVEDVTFWQMHGGTGHCFDIDGSDGVTIRDCWFYGHNPDPGSDQCEAINTDIDIAGSLTKGTLGDCSGLMSKNITVEKCHFRPLTVDGTFYYASNPMGLHIAAEGQWVENMRFIDNEVIDCRPNAPTSIADGSNDDFYRGAVHIPCAKGLWFTGNTFTLTKGQNTRALTVMSQNDGVLSASDPNHASVRGLWAHAVPAQNIWVMDNKFEGFNNSDACDIVYIKGVSNGSSDTGNAGWVDGVHIQNNTWRKGPTEAGSTTYGKGCAAYLQYVNDAVVTGNTLDDYYRGFFCWTGSNIKIDDNAYSNVVYRPALMEHTTGFSINQNNLINSGAIQISLGVCNGTIQGNTAVFTSDVPDNGVIDISSGNYVVCTGNSLHNGSGVRDVGISIGNSTVKSTIVSQNVIVGFTHPTTGSGSGTMSIEANITS